MERRGGGATSWFAQFGDYEPFARACRDDEAFERSFGTEARCVEWLRRTRWPQGFECPGCRRRGGRWIAERRGYQCACRKFTSVTAGTILHGTQKPLRKWFEALFLVVQRGVNARTLQREIGLTYKVAWMWGHKLRSLLGAHATPREVKDKRERFVTYEAEREKYGPGPTWPRAGVRGPCGCSKLVARDWRWVDQPKTSWFVVAVPPPEFDRRRFDVYAHWQLLATYCGSVSEKHLRSYMDELAFRMNRAFRSARESFTAVAGEVVKAEPRPWKTIVAKVEPAPESKPVSIYARLEKKCGSGSPTTRTVSSRIGSRTPST